MALVYTRRTLTSLLSRSLRFSCKPSSNARFSVVLSDHYCHELLPRNIGCPTRSKVTTPSYSPIGDSSPNYTNRPPTETIRLDGCDYEHWLIVLEFTEDPKPSRDEMIDIYVKTLAQVVGSEDEAKSKIYSVCTTTYTGFGALISEELSNKVKELPRVLWVLPDSYLDVRNKDYGGELYVNGEVVPRPKYQYRRRQP